MRLTPGTIAVTMAGFGSRFAKAGYTQPKYQIEALGRPLFDWSMMALSAFRDAGWAFSFALRAADGAAGFVRQRCHTLDIRIDHLLELDAPTDGQATTARMLAEQTTREAPFAVFNIDTFVRPGAMTPADIASDCDGWIPCFPAPGDGWSFARTDAVGQVVELREKQRISDHATVGFYWFRSAALYLDSYTRFFAKGGEEKGERYIAPLYNQLIADKCNVRLSYLSLNDVGMLGTPEQVNAFISRPPSGARKIVEERK